MAERSDSTGQAERLDRALHSARDAIGSTRDVERLQSRLRHTLAGEPANAQSPDVAPAASSVSKAALIVGGLLGAAALYMSVDATRTPAPSAHVPAAPPVLAPVAPAPPVATLPSRDSSAASDTLPRVPAPAGAKARSRARAQPRPSHLEPSAEAQPLAAKAAASTEIALITRAQMLVDRQPEAALAILLEHEREFPRGILAEERDVLRFDAERTLGHAARAIAYAEAFRAHYPNSPQTRRLEHWLAARENIEGDHK